MRKAGGIVMAGLLAAACAASAAELKNTTREAYTRYREAAEQRISAELKSGASFITFEDRGENGQQQARERLRNGEVVIERVPPAAGQHAHLPGGLVHDWVATAFIPQATLEDALRLAQDYDHHQQGFAPEVEKSRLLAHAGDDFRIFYRLRRTKVITVVLNTEHEVHYARLDAAHAYSRSYSTRIAEVENPDRADERELKPGDGHGFLWQLDSYWRFEQADGGVYIQCEAISLTRDIPAGLGWMIGPFVESIPRESLSSTMANTRKAIAELVAKRHSPVTAAESNTQ